MQVVLDGVGQVVTILSTGEGKSLLFMLPSMLPSVGTTVVILPLIGLKHDMMRRLECMGLGYKVWESKEDEEVGCPLVFVSVDKAVSVTFRSYLNRLEAGNGLDRVIFDESHLAITASRYRPKMGLVKYLRSLRCQFVYLTATLPPTMVNRFEQAMLLWQPRMIRSLTLRTDLEYWVRRSSMARLQDFAVAEIRATLQEGWFIQEQGARCIIYTITKLEANEVAERLQGLVYYSDSGTDSEKASALAKWVDGESRVMVATSAFGPGINHGHVRAVFHIGAPASAIDFAQEAGRAGRDDEGGISCIFLPKKWKAVDVGPAGELLPDETKVMQRYLDNPRCRLLPLGIFLDGVRQTCKGESRLCDRCRELGILVGAELAAASESREGDVGMLEGADECSSSSSAEDLEVGSRLLKQHVRDQERCLQRYIGNLRQLKGSCLICRLVNSADPSTLETVRGADHGLEKCGAVSKWRFINSKRAAIKEGQQQFEAGQRRHKGWLSTYTSCFKCGNPQTICAKQGKGQCEYGDILMPACWGAY
jgi:superfamily II DNA helicase RecQ